jgi:hypothetical protein
MGSQQVITYKYRAISNISDHGVLMCLSGPALSQFDLLVQIGARAGVIYSWLFKYAYHTAGFTENNWSPHLLRLCCVHILFVVPLVIYRGVNIYLLHFWCLLLRTCMLICTSENFVDTKFVIRSRKSKDIPFQMKEVPNTNNDQQNVFYTGKGYGV